MNEREDFWSAAILVVTAAVILLWLLWKYVI